MTHLAVYRINAPQVIGEVIEGEAIIVNLESGAYYSLQGTGALVWTLLGSGASLENINAVVTAQYTGDAGSIAQAVLSLVEELQREGLISAVETAPGDSFAAAPVLPVERREFVAPVLAKYTDMADLLLLDPIHEVDAPGWPQPASTRP
jgi:hypothetical protein